MLRKGMFTLYGAIYLLLSKDKIGKSQLARAPDADEIASRIDSEVRIIFIRHGESMWNLVFNRGFGPSFLVRLVKAVLYELYLIPFDDSCFLDSPYWVHIIETDELDREATALVNLVNASGRFSDACASVYREEEAWKCIFGEYRMPFLRVPYLMNAAQYDSFQMSVDFPPRVPFWSEQNIRLARSLGRSDRGDDRPRSRWSMRPSLRQ